MQVCILQANMGFKAYVPEICTTAIQQLDLFSIYHVWGTMLGNKELNIWKINVFSELFSLQPENLLKNNTLRNRLNILSFLKNTVRQNLNVTQDAALQHMDMHSSYYGIKIFWTNQRLSSFHEVWVVYPLIKTYGCQVVDIYLERVYICRPGSFLLNFSNFHLISNFCSSVSII